MSRSMTEFEERRMDQLAFAADDAEREYKMRPKGLPLEKREALRDQMETTQAQLTAFVQKAVDA